MREKVSNTALSDKYFVFDELNNDKVMAVYSKKPMDFNTAVIGQEGRRRLYETIQEDLQYRFRKAARVSQVHGDRVVIVNEENLDDVIGEADGLLTDLKGVSLEIRTADCQSIFLYDPVRGVIGNVHSGWKGTLQGIAVKAVDLMIRAYGCRAEDIEAYINPSILKESFEVEDDVIGQFRAVVDVEKYAEPTGIVDGRQKYHMDTAAINRDALTAAGLRPENIHESGIDTVTHRDVYHSYRGDAHAAGRNGSLICLR